MTKEGYHWYTLISSLVSLKISQDDFIFTTNKITRNLTWYCKVELITTNDTLRKHSYFSHTLHKQFSDNTQVQLKNFFVFSLLLIPPNNTILTFLVILFAIKLYDQINILRLYISDLFFNKFSSNERSFLTLVSEWLKISKVLISGSSLHCSSFTANFAFLIKMCAVHKKVEVRNGTLHKNSLGNLH